MNDQAQTPDTDTDSRPRTLSEQIVKALAEGRNKRVRKLLHRMHPAKIAALLERLSPAQRVSLWQQIGGTLEQRVLGHLSTELRPTLMRESREDSEADAAPAPPAQQGE